MSSTTKIRVAILTTAAMLIVGSIAILACAPTAPARAPEGQSSSEEPTATLGATLPIVVGGPAPTLTGTPPMIYLHNPEGTLIPVEKPKERTPTPTRIVGPRLQQKLDEFKTLKRTRGAPSEAELERMKWFSLVVETESIEAATEAANLLREQGSWIGWIEEGSTYAEVRVDQIAAVVDEIQGIEGVRRIDRGQPVHPGGKNHNGYSPKHQGDVANDVHGVAAWHGAGVRGNGVHVGVIDANFERLRQSLLATTRTRTHGLCYDGQNGPSTTLRDCEQYQGPPDNSQSGHGTKIVQELLRIAPGVTLYVSNAHDDARVRYATMWMTNPDPETHAAHALTVDVKAINASVETVWDGPGDGTATDGRPTVKPMLNTAKAAIEHGAIWITHAGNMGKQSWFSREVQFTENYLDILETGTPGTTCLMTYLTKNQTYRYVMRWEDEWPATNTATGPSTDLQIFLYNGEEEIQPILGTSDETQNGGSDQYPREVMTFRANETGDHCVYINKKSGPDPDWIQIRSRDQEFKTVTTGSSQGSISNPAESNNPGLLAVGATEADGQRVLRHSSHGPAPEPGPPNERVKPDIVAVGMTGIEEATSFAAPRVAGLAALVIQARGEDDDYDEPHEIAQYLKSEAVQMGSPDPNNDWGHGLAQLPTPDPPTNVQISTPACITSPQVKVTWNESAWPAIDETGNNIRYQVKIKTTNGRRTHQGHSIIRFGSAANGGSQ